MLRATIWAVFGALEVVGLKTQRNLLTADTIPIPVIVEKKPRKKHVCTWTDQEVWGVFWFALLLGIFLGYLI